MHTSFNFEFINEFTKLESGMSFSLSIGYYAQPKGDHLPHDLIKIKKSN